MNSVDTPRVSVIMSVFNGEHYLRYAIDSILSQTFKDFEFLIIDDGSTDRSQEIIHSFSDTRIHLICNTENIGLTKSLNNGISLALGEYIARMDADDISHPTRLERQVAYLDSHPDVALVGACADTIDDTGLVVGTLCYLASPSFSDFLAGNQVIHGTMLVRKKILEFVGGYPEYFRLSQDYALLLNISEKFTVCNLQEILYRLRIHNQSVSMKNINKSIAFHILAVRYVKNEPIDVTAYPITDDNFQDFFASLNYDEKIFYHTARAGIFRAKIDLKQVRNEYLHLIKLSPINLNYWINYLRAFFGNKMMDVSTDCYIKIISLLR